MKIESIDHHSGNQRRAAILEAATDLFLEQGYDRTSLEQIIERAGGSRRAIYQQFGNKEGLFIAVIEAIIEHLLDRLSVLTWQDRSPEQTLIQAGTALVRALTSSKMLAVFRMLITEVTRFPDLGRTFFRKGPERAYQQMSQYLQQQARSGYLQIDHPDVAARQLIEMMKGDLHLRAMFCPEDIPTDAEIETHVQLAVQTFLKGVCYTYTDDCSTINSVE